MESFFYRTRRVGCPLREAHLCNRNLGRLFSLLPEDGSQSSRQPAGDATFPGWSSTRSTAGACSTYTVTVSPSRGADASNPATPRSSATPTQRSPWLTSILLSRYAERSSRMPWRSANAKRSSDSTSALTGVTRPSSSARQASSRSRLGALSTWEPVRVSSSVGLRGLSRAQVVAGGRRKASVVKWWE